MTRQEAFAKLCVLAQDVRTYDHSIYVQEHGEPVQRYRTAVAFHLDSEWLGVATERGDLLIYPISKVSIWSGPPGP